jgi:hypothetical protein
MYTLGLILNCKFSLDIMNPVNSVVLTGRSLRQTAMCDSLQSVSSLEKESAHYILSTKPKADRAK